MHQPTDEWFECTFEIRADDDCLFHFKIQMYAQKGDAVQNCMSLLYGISSS